MEGEGRRLPLASLPDGALALVLSFGEVPDLVAANNVRQALDVKSNCRLPAVIAYAS